MKKIILILVLAFGFLFAKSQPAPYLSGVGTSPGNYNFVFLWGQFADGVAYPDTIWYTVVCQVTPDSPAYRQIRQMFIHNTSQFLDTLWEAPGYSYNITYEVSNGYGSPIHSAYTSYTSYPAGIIESANDDQKIWNPQGTRALNWRNLDETSTLSIINMIGQSVFSKNLESKSGELALNDLPAGIYIAFVSNGSAIEKLKIQIE
jgi:hypothetical protein